MADPGSALTVVLIAVFVTALALGLLFLLGNRRNADEAGVKKEPREKPSPPLYREQGRGAVLATGTMGDGIRRIFSFLDNAVNLFFSGLIFIYKWAFNYHSPPSAPNAATVVSDEPRTRIDTPPPPEPVSQPAPATPQPQLKPPPVPPALPASATPALIQYRPPAPPPPPPVVNLQPAGRPYGLQAIIDIMGEGIEIALTGMSGGIVFIFDGFINLFKWIFRIDR